MNISEVHEIEDDILEAFADFGTIDEQANVTWLKQIPAEYNTLNQQNVSKKYTPYTSITGLATGKATEIERKDIAVSKTNVLKMYIVARYFDALGIKPSENDRMKYKGVVYDVLNIKPTEIGGVPILYCCFVSEATFTAQDEAYREEVDPYFEIDASQDEKSTNDSGVNTGNFTYEPAVAVSELDDAVYTVTFNSNDKMKVSYCGGSPVTFSLPAGINLLPAAISGNMQAALDTAFGANVFLVSVLPSGSLRIATVATGNKIFFELHAIPADAYYDLGFVEGVFKGDEHVTLAPNPPYGG